MQTFLKKFIAFNFMQKVSEKRISLSLKSFILTICAVYCVFVLKAQLPSTDIWIMTLELDSTSATIEYAENITNRAGYDNQPYFTADGNNLLYVSADSNGNTEIFTYNLLSKTHLKLTETFESEYSPQADSLHLIRAVRLDSLHNQFIYSYNPLENSNQRIFPTVDSVGYFVEAEWKLVYFKITTPSTLWLFDDEKEILLGENPGRCLKKTIDGKQVLFTLNQNGDHILFLTKNKGVHLIGKLPEKSEFFEPISSESIIISGTNGLYYVNLKKGTHFLLRLPEALLNKKFSRMSLSHDKKKLAVVINE